MTSTPGDDPTRPDDGRLRDAPGAGSDNPTRRDQGRVPRGRGGRGGAGRGDDTVLDPGRRRPDATVLDPGRGRPGGAGPPDDADDDELPPGLAARFTIVNELGSGGEARLYLVREASAEGEAPLRVLKVYRPERVPDRRASAWLVRRGGPSGRSAGLAEVHEADVAGGRAYEVMEYLAGGDLRELARTTPERLDTATITAIVQQVAGALQEMDAAGIVHRDVKPANLVLRSREPFTVALADFGLATFVGPGVSTFARPDGEPFAQAQLLTFRYAAPEWLVARSLSAKADWWALGMTIAELAAGRHPFAGLDDEVILKHFVTTRPVELRDVTDPRLNLLCRGLLVRDDAARWGHEQVGEWLQGQSPEVADEYTTEGMTAPGPSRQPFLYKGAAYTDPALLAAVLANDWDAAASWLFPGRRSDAGPWRQLRQWLGTLDGPAHAEPGRSLMIRALERGGESAHVRLCRLVRWLDPLAAPVYRRAEITTAELPALARRAAGRVPGGAPGLGEGAASDVVDDLWEHRLLPELAHAPGGAGLADADRRWRQWHEWWLDLADVAGRQPGIGQLLPAVPQATILAFLLWLATEEQTAGAWLARQAARERGSLPQQVAWFSWLTEPGAGPLSHLCAVLLAGPAALEAQQAIEDRARDRERRQRMLAGQAVRAWFVRHDRPTALGWAASGIALVAMFWTWTIALCDVLPFASASAVALAWESVILATAVLAAAELGLAGLIGGPYHPRYSLIGAGILRLAAEARAVRDRGLLVLAVVVTALAVLLAATSYLPFVLPTASTIGELAWVVARHRRWRADEEARMRELNLAEAERRAAAGLAGMGADRP